VKLDRAQFADRIGRADEWGRGWGGKMRESESKLRLSPKLPLSVGVAATAARHLWSHLL